MDDAPDFTAYDTRLGGYAVVVRDDHPLLVAWNEPEVPTWALPGGGIELHEELEAGVVREVREETGYDVRLDELLGVRTEVTAPDRRLPPGERWLRQVQVLLAATVVGGALVAEVGGTTDEARWIPLADVPSLVRAPQVDTALELLARR